MRKWKGISTNHKKWDLNCWKCLFTYVRENCKQKRNYINDSAKQNTLWYISFKFCCNLYLNWNTCGLVEKWAYFLQQQSLLPSSEVFEKTGTTATIDFFLFGVSLCFPRLNRCSEGRRLLLAEAHTLREWHSCPKKPNSAPLKYIWMHSQFCLKLHFTTYDPSSFPGSLILTPGASDKFLV